MTEIKVLIPFLTKKGNICSTSKGVYTPTSEAYKTRRALDRAHLPPTKLFRRLAVINAIVKPRIAAAQCLYRVSTTPGNLLEFENPPGNLLEFKWSSWKFLCNDQKFYFMVNGFTT